MPHITDPNHRLRINEALTRNLNLRWGMGLALAISLLGVPDAWALQVSPMSLTFTGPQAGTNPPSQSLSFSKGNNSPLSWTITDNATWVSVTPASGTMRRSASITLGVNTTGLAMGSYTATVTITLSNGGSISVPVSLSVIASTATAPTSTSSPSGNTATLSWIASTSTGVVGYNVYVGTASGVYDSAPLPGRIEMVHLNLA